MDSLKQSCRDDSVSGSFASKERPSRAPLDDLPEELLLRILSYIEGIDKDSVERYSTLASLCGTSRRLHRITTPALYRHYTSGENRYRFVRTVVTTPALAAHVRSLHWYAQPIQGEIAPKDNEVAQRLKEYNEYFAVQAALATQSQQYQRSEENIDGYFTAALMHVPNVECITLIDSAFLDKDPERRWLMPIRLRIPHLFRHLKSIDVSMKMITSEHIECFMGLPSLRQLSVSECSHDPRDPLMLSPNTSNVEELRFSLCSIQGIEVAHIIECCRSLRKFYFRSISLYHDGSVWTMKRIKHGLDSQMSSLRLLELYRDLPLDGIDQNSYSDIGSFETYQVLESLRAPASFLLPSYVPHFLDIIPSGLTELRIDEIGYKGGLSALLVMAKMAAILKERCQGLNRIYFSDDVTRVLKSSGWQQMKKAFAKEEIDLMI